MAPAYISVELRRQVHADAGGRCGYCHTPEILIGMPLDIDHLLAEARGGATIRENLWLACTRCNGFKADRSHAPDPISSEQVPLFNPRTQVWTEHFSWALDGITIVGHTAIGRATVVALRLNNDHILVTRQFWVLAGRWPPLEDQRRG